MVALDGLIQKRYKIYSIDLVDSIRATMQGFLDEVRSLAPAEVQITEEGQAARSRLAAMVDELALTCQQVQGLITAAN